MKKICYLLVLMVFVLSCSEDESGGCKSDLSYLEVVGDATGNNIVFTGEEIYIGIGKLCDNDQPIVLVNGAQVDVLSRSGTNLSFIFPLIDASTAEIIVQIDGVNYSLPSVTVVQAGGHWEEAAVFPGDGRMNAVSFETSTEGYLASGTTYVGDLNNNEEVHHKDLYKYVAGTNTWTKVTTHDNFEWLEGGVFGNGNFITDPYRWDSPAQIYSLAQNKFTALGAYESITGSPWGSIMSYSNGNFYGFINKDNASVVIQKHDMTANTWDAFQEVSVLKEGKQFSFSFVVGYDDKIYLGISYSNTAATDLWRFDGKDNSFTKLSTCFQGMITDAFVLNGNAYFIQTGESSLENNGLFITQPEEKLIVYNFEHDQWRLVTTDFPEPMFKFTGLTIGNRAFAGMGSTASGSAFVHSKNFFEFIVGD